MFSFAFRLSRNPSGTSPLIMPIIRSGDMLFIMSHMPFPGSTVKLVASLTAFATSSMASGHLENSSMVSWTLYMPSGNSMGAFRSISPMV